VRLGIFRTPIFMAGLASNQFAFGGPELSGRGAR
jgi:hypothetical protein